MPNSYPGVYKLKCSCGSVVRKHEQESITGNWSSCRATKDRKECHGHFESLYHKILFIKNRCRYRKLRESLDTDVAIVRYW